MKYPRGTAKYRKKPVAVFAVRWNPRQRYWPPNVVQYAQSSFVRTAHGDVEIQVGDWVCWQNVRGKVDVWPVAAHIFEATYEPAL